MSSTPSYEKIIGYPTLTPQYSACQITTFSPTNRPLLGQRVEFDQKMIRTYIRTVGGRDGHTWSAVSLKQPRHGVYVGYRVKQEGYIAYYPDEGTEWKRTGSIYVALVACDEHKAPIPVPFNALVAVK